MIEIIHITPQLAVVVRSKVAFADMPKAQREARPLVDQAIAAAGAPPGERLTVWQFPQDGVVDYAPGVLVPSRFETTPPVELIDLPAGRAAHLVLDGPFEKLPDAWNRLFTACAEQGLKPAGTNWEVYAAHAPPQTRLYALLA